MLNATMKKALATRRKEKKPKLTGTSQHKTRTARKPRRTPGPVPTNKAAASRTPRTVGPGGSPSNQVLPRASQRRWTTRGVQDAAASWTFQSAQRRAVALEHGHPPS